jgi:hypothetical protein
MTDKIMFATIITCLTFLLCSCKKEITYDCTLINETKYRINKIEFSCAVDKKTVSILPFGTSYKFELRYVKSSGRFFSEPLLCITVTEYSDSTQTYQNSIGHTMSISALQKTNKLVIKYEPSPFYPSDIFKVTRR